ncbi:MAG: hypothetical protein IJ019_06720 [Alphaproteobacteria bacterium]|nr:hypothetical protein [Alphaproteobacteria bacterium]
MSGGYVLGPGGIVVPEEKAKEWFNEDGKEHKDDVKTSNFSKLLVAEKIKANKFLESHPELTSSEGRTRMFKEDIAEELLRLREEDNKRMAAGKPLLTEKQKELLIPRAGVISSRWRHEEIVKTNKEMTQAHDAMFKDALGMGQDR